MLASQPDLRARRSQARRSGSSLGRSPPKRIPPVRYRPPCVTRNPGSAWRGTPLSAACKQASNRSFVASLALRQAGAHGASPPEGGVAPEFAARRPQSRRPSTPEGASSRGHHRSDPKVRARQHRYATTGFGQLPASRHHPFPRVAVSHAHGKPQAGRSVPSFLDRATHPPKRGRGTVPVFQLRRRSARSFRPARMQCRGPL